jgi:hypothetical protein
MNGRGVLVTSPPLYIRNTAHPRLWRLSPEESTGLPKIPSLPLAWRDAQILLQGLKGHDPAVDVVDRLPLYFILQVHQMNGRGVLVTSPPLYIDEPAR